MTCCYILQPEIFGQPSGYITQLVKQQLSQVIIQLMSERVQESQSQQLSNKPALHAQHANKTEDEQINYYNEYCRLYLANQVLATQLKELNIQKVELVSKLIKLQKKAEELSEGNSGQVDEKKRRVRRSAGDIARHYKCQIEGCTKSYGSQGSLNQHIKLKHPEIYQPTNKDYIKEYDNEEDESP